MDRLPKDVFDMVVEKVSSLDDLGALWLTNRCMASMCKGIQAKTFVADYAPVLSCGLRQSW